MNTNETVPVIWNGREISACVPIPLSRRDLSLSDPEIRATEQAIAALQKSDSDVSENREESARHLLLCEGVASSGIEGLREPIASVLVAEHSNDTGPAGWIADNIAVIDMANQTAHEKLSTDTLHDWHSQLMRNSDLPPDLIGAFRDRISWVGGSSPHDAAYVPPPPELVPDLMQDLIEFADSTDPSVDPITRAAVIHAQFEAIHPYGDGNGRLGRILISRAFRRSQFTTYSTVPMSVAIARDPGGYLSGLVMYQQMGTVGPYVKWFAETAQKAADVTAHLAQRTNEIIDSWSEQLSDLRAHSTARNLIPILVGNPVISAQDIMDLLKASYPSARDALQTLADREILEPVQVRSSGIGRNRQWYAATAFLNTWSP